MAGKVAFITGGGTGIGEAVAEQFAAAGGRVVVMGRRLARVQPVAERLGGLAVAGDAACTDDVRRAIAAAREKFGSIDVLVANAGGHGVGDALATDDAAWAEATRLNLDTAFVCARELLPELIEQRGNIVVVSSIAGHFAPPCVVGYVTMKHALIGLVRSLARDYGKQGIRVNAVCPGWVRTEMADEQMQMLTEKFRLADKAAAYELVTRDVPLRRAANPEDVANAVLFLASPLASMITGSSLMVDGGASAVDLPSIIFDHIE
ncbi:TPA: SDR family oxidoreductase [Burkholderia cepacia]|uniref:SDR family NAD(P)-dependent oxidoreductase n=1 Tax=Burkholderia metallica TaxID=488729 RepID=UPI000B75F3EB|nr:SDR family oxidoreductase [Burkholderia metallica]OUE46154.1 3-oxoacyl-ACP reductase [Burkholderia territorii]HDR9503703.1 SDR family oxidoreductase [Burkholderia cepacia]